MAGYFSTLAVAQSDGTAVTTATAASILPASAKYTLPANYLWFIGKKLRITATGRISNAVTGPYTMTFRVNLGASSVVTSTAIPLNTTAKTNVSWYLDAYMTVRSVGTAATIFGQGSWESESVSGSAAGLANGVLLQASAPAVGATFDTTVAQQIDLTAQWNTAIAGNTIQLHSYTLIDMTTTP